MNGQDDTGALPTLLDIGSLNGPELEKVTEGILPADGPESGRFPEGVSDRVFRRDLVGWPFVVMSDAIFRTRPAHYDETSGTKFDAQEVAQFWMAFYDADSQTVGEPKLAEVNGAYLISQIKRLGKQLATRRLWTIARNPNMKRHPQYGYPFMLATWSPEVDSPQDGEQDEGYFAEEPKQHKPARK